MTLQYVLDPGGGNELTLTESDIIRQNPVKTHTGKADLRATVAGLFDTLKDYAQRQDRLNINVDGSTKWTGYIVGVSQNKKRGTTRLKADGIAKKLEETRPDYANLSGGSVSYSNIALEDAINDYWGRTAFGNFSVTAQSTETVATNASIQKADTNSEWTNITAFPDDSPFTVSGGTIKMDDASYFLEGEDFNGLGGNPINTVSDSEASGGTALSIAAADQDQDIGVTTDYRIPANDVGVGVRLRAPNDPDSDGNYELWNYGVFVDGEHIGGITDGTSFSSSGYRWLQSLGLSSDLSAGSHTIKLEAESDNSGTTYIDCVVLYDDRYSYTFDNQVDSNSALSGPEPKPDVAAGTLEPGNASFHITEVDINATLSKGSGIEEIAVSGDGGSTFQTASNTTSATFTISEKTRSVITRYKLARFNDSNKTTSPTAGTESPEIDVHEILADGNNLVIIDELELTRNHFDNLLELHEYGDFQWTIEHSSGSVSNMTVVSYQEGDETRPQPDGFNDPVNQEREVNAGTYFNSVYVQGALDSSGSRPTAEVKDQNAINNDGRTISPGVLRDPKVTSEAGATFRARSLLNAALDNDQLEGRVTTVPQYTHPGYARPVDFGNGEKNKTVERVSLTESPTQVQAVFEFTSPEDLSQQIAELRRNQREQGDKI